MPTGCVNRQLFVNMFAIKKILGDNMSDVVFSMYHIDHLPHSREKKGKREGKKKCSEIFFDRDRENGLKKEIGGSNPKRLSAMVEELAKKIKQLPCRNCLQNFVRWQGQRCRKVVKRDEGQKLTLYNDLPQDNSQKWP